MARQETDFPVSELMTRYDLVRSQVYARINALKAQNADLAPFKVGVKSYVNQVVLGCLDEMHRLITEEELTTEEAAERVAGASETSIEPNNQQTVSAIQQTEMFGDAIALVPDEHSEKAPIVAIKQALQGEPFARYEMLDRVVEKGWWLPTSELAALLELRTLSGESFERYGYRFLRMGKAGAEGAWKVEKLS